MCSLFAYILYQCTLRNLRIHLQHKVVHTISYYTNWGGTSIKLVVRYSIPYTTTNEARGAIARLQSKAPHHLACDYPPKRWWWYDFQRLWTLWLQLLFYDLRNTTAPYTFNWRTHGLIVCSRIKSTCILKKRLVNLFLVINWLRTSKPSVLIFSVLNY